MFSRALLDRAGAYESSEYDGAQDHDLMLRLTEQTTRDKIAHIKKVLYIWRGHAGSTAAGMEAKPYALAAGVRCFFAGAAGESAVCGVLAREEAFCGWPSAKPCRWRTRPVRSRCGTS